MNVWIRVTRKRVKCYHCEKMIETDEYQVVCTYFMKLKYIDKTWAKAMHFHAEPNCWLERAKNELSTRTYSEQRGRKAVIRDKNNELVWYNETKTKRRKILARRASVMQRIGQEMENSSRPEKLLRLTALLDKLAVEIEQYGGVPKSWK